MKINTPRRPNSASVISGAYRDQAARDRLDDLGLLDVDVIGMGEAMYVDLVLAS